MKGRIAVAVFALVVTLIALLLFTNILWNPFRIPIVKKTKLLTLTESDAQAQIIAPEALNVYFILALSENASPGRETVNVDFIFLSNSQQVASLSWSHRVSVNWLQDDSLDEFMVPISSNRWDLSDVLTPKGAYRIEIKGAPLGSSAWLLYKYPSGWDAPMGFGRWLKTKRLSSTNGNGQPGTGAYRNR